MWAGAVAYSLLCGAPLLRTVCGAQKMFTAYLWKEERKRGKANQRKKGRQRGREGRKERKGGEEKNSSNPCKAHVLFSQVFPPRF